MHETTIDRDIRMTPEQIHYTSNAIDRRIRELGVKINRAEGLARSGNTIQRGTLGRHYDELQALLATRELLEVATRQIQHRIRESLGMERQAV